MIKKIFLIAIGIILISIVLVYFSKKKNQQYSPDLKTSSESVQAEPKIESKNQYITSAECQSSGGEITHVDPKKQECPDKKIFLGMVKDVNCICACCK